MKFTVTTEDELEAQLLAKSKDYHFLVWDFVQKLNHDIKYDESPSKEVMEERLRIRKVFLNLLEDYKIDINLLP